MILSHENMAEEAEYIAQVISEVYGIESVLFNEDNSSIFTPIPKFGGYLRSIEKTRSIATLGSKKFILTPKDIYVRDDSKDDAWQFGYSTGDCFVVSTARMKQPDSTPSDVLGIAKEKYLQRLAFIAIHEIGHDVIKGEHFYFVSYVNNTTNYWINLGRHCTDNACVMYEVIDIRAPAKDEAYLFIRNLKEKRYDSGIDDILEHMHPGWFCDRCKESIRVPDEYKIK